MLCRRQDSNWNKHRSDLIKRCGQQTDGRKMVNEWTFREHYILHERDMSFARIIYISSPSDARLPSCACKPAAWLAMARKVPAAALKAYPDPVGELQVKGVRLVVLNCSFIAITEA